jgi:hypothetical protein
MTIGYDSTIVSTPRLRCRSGGLPKWSPAENSSKPRHNSMLPRVETQGQAAPMTSWGTARQTSIIVDEVADEQLNERSSKATPR